MLTNQEIKKAFSCALAINSRELAKLKNEIIEEKIGDNDVLAKLDIILARTNVLQMFMEPDGYPTRKGRATATAPAFLADAEDDNPDIEDPEVKREREENAERYNW